MWTKRERGAHSNDTAAGDSRRAATPGKHTLTEALAPVQPKAESLGHVAQPVQRKADGTSGGEVMAAAQHGVSGPSQALPHGDRIQALFGRHDVSGIRAHVAGPAAEASEQITAGKKGAGDDSFVDLDADVGDSDVKVHDAAGNDISDPVYIFLGHELIHARHIAAGEVDMGAPADASYDLKEEKITIATAGSARTTCAPSTA